MPADYKYGFISKGRMKALEKAADELSDLCKLADQLKPNLPVLKVRLKTVRALVARAANRPLDASEIEMLENIFGAELGEERG